MRQELKTQSVSVAADCSDRAECLGQLSAMERLRRSRRFMSH